MNTPRERLTPKQQRALTALLTSPTHVEAARKANMSVTSLWRILRNERFQEVYRGMRKQIMESVIWKAQQSCGEALDTLMTINRNEEANDSPRLQAAKALLEVGFKGYEIEHMEERLAVLEARQNELGAL